MTRSHQDVVLVTGATCRVGRLLVDELLRAGATVRALTRRPQHAALPAGVEVVAGDLTVPASLDPALEGAVAVFLVWTAAPATAPAVVARLSAHSSPQPRRVVYLSSPHQTPHPFFQQPNPMRGLHVEIERLLAATSLGVAVIRPGMFASNARHWWAPQIRDGDVVRWPCAAAETAPVDERDIAAAAARALLDGRHAGGDYVLTGPESLSQSRAGTRDRRRHRATAPVRGAVARRVPARHGGYVAGRRRGDATHRVAGGARASGFRHVRRSGDHRITAADFLPAGR